MFVVDIVEDGIPDVGSYIGTHILIEAFTGPAIKAADFQSFPDFEIVVEAALTLVLHAFNNLEIFFVERLGALLVVLRNTGVMPLAFLDGLAVLIPSKVKGTSRLANVISCVRAGAGVFVYAFLFVCVRFGFVFAAKYVF